MINHNDYYYDLDFVPNFIEMIYKELELSIVESKFYQSPYNQNRADVSADLKNKVCELFIFPISDIGFFRNLPLTSYPFHCDAERQFAVNLLLCDADEKFEVCFYDFEYRKKINVPYRKNIPLVFNTKKSHSITNKHEIKTRYIFTIGSTKINYNDGLTILLDKFHKTEQK